MCDHRHSCKDPRSLRETYRRLTRTTTPTPTMVALITLHNQSICKFRHSYHLRVSLRVPSAGRARTCDRVCIILARLSKTTIKMMRLLGLNRWQMCTTSMMAKAVLQRENTRNSAERSLLLNLSWRISRKHLLLRM